MNFLKLAIQLQYSINYFLIHRVIRQETSYNVDELLASLPDRVRSLNEDQRAVYETVLRTIDAHDGKTFALQASGGTGKTYTVNLILDTVRSRGEIALATAMSGIAATLLHNGRTLHSCLKVPINIHENSTCNFTKRDATGKQIDYPKITHSIL